jgi:hypothetical protein
MSNNVEVNTLDIDDVGALAEKLPQVEEMLKRVLERINHLSGRKALLESRMRRMIVEWMDAHNRINVLERRLMGIVSVLGPEGPPQDCENDCHGCKYEMAEALAIAKGERDQQPKVSNGTAHS